MNVTSNASRQTQFLQTPSSSPPPSANPPNFRRLITPNCSLYPRGTLSTAAILPETVYYRHYTLIAVIGILSCVVSANKPWNDAEAMCAASHYACILGNPNEAPLRRQEICNYCVTESCSSEQCKASWCAINYSGTPNSTNPLGGCLYQGGGRGRTDKYRFWNETTRACVAAHQACKIAPNNWQRPRFCSQCTKNCKSSECQNNKDNWCNNNYNFCKTRI